MSMEWPFLRRSLFPPSFPACSAELCSTRAPPDKAQTQPAAPRVGRGAARQMPHCNSFVPPRLPAFQGLGKINESKTFCPKHNSHHFQDAKHLIQLILAWLGFCQWNKMPPLYSLILIGRPHAQWSSCVRMALCHSHDWRYHDLNSFYSHSLQKQL